MFFRQIIRLIIGSLIATLLPLPINAIDVVIATTSHNRIILNTILAPIFDTVFAVITYLLAHKLVRLFAKNSKGLKQSQLMLNRGKDIGLFIASATPAPFTLTIYVIGIVGYGKTLLRFMLIVYIGRLIKYAVLGGAIYFGIEIIQLSWQHWTIFGVMVANIALIYYNKSIGSKLLLC